MTMLRRSALTVSVALLALAACGDPDAVGQPGPTDPPPASPTSDPAPTAPTTASTTAPTDTLPPETLVPVEFRYDPEALRAELDAARGRWVDGDHDAYRFEYQYVCFCDPDETRADVEVIDGRVVNDNDRGTFSSVDEWFDIIDQAIGTAADVRVAYADAGYPTSLYIDVEEQMADEEFGLELIAFTDEPHPVAAFLTDPYGCGYQFTAATPDQSASVTVAFDDVAGPNGPADGTYELADLAGTVRFGADLTANWCNDVVDPDQPEPITEVTWTIVAGTVDVTRDATTVTGTLAGIVAMTPDGREVDLGDVTIANEAWGVFAG